MISLQTIQDSNAQIASLPQGLVALFIGATSGIGQSALQQFAQHAASPRIYTVARPQSAAVHEALLASLRKSNPTGTYTLIPADISLVSEIDAVAAAIKQHETKLDILFLTAGFIAFEGRANTREGLDPSMTTRYYSRLRAVQLLLPLLTHPAAPSPRIVSVLAGGIEGPLNELDLDLRAEGGKNWSFWNASVHTATMGTLALERFARENPRLSVVHSFPGLVKTPGLHRATKFGFVKGEEGMSAEEAGARALFYATSDRYAVEGGGGLVPVADGLASAVKSGGGIFLVDPQGKITDNEMLLADLRKRAVDEKVWAFTQGIFDACVAGKAQDVKNES